MRFEWDEQKNRANRAKHGIGFETAVQAFDDPFSLAKFDRIVEKEERWQLLGTTPLGIMFVVAHAYRWRDDEEVIRIFSARKANAYDRQSYERGY